MKKTIFIIGFCIMSLVAMSQPAQEQHVLDLSKKKFQWMVTMQFDSLQAVLDDRMMFIHSNGWLETKTEFIHDIRSGKLRYKSIDIIEATARVYPGSAIIIGRGKFVVTLDGKDLQLELKYTEVYFQQNGKWLLASRHANRLQ